MVMQYGAVCHKTTIITSNMQQCNKNCTRLHGSYIARYVLSTNVTPILYAVICPFFSERCPILLVIRHCHMVPKAIHLYTIIFSSINEISNKNAIYFAREGSIYSNLQVACIGFPLNTKALTQCGLESQYGVMDFCRVCNTPISPGQCIVYSLLCPSCAELFWENIPRTWMYSQTYNTINGASDCYAR